MSRNFKQSFAQFLQNFTQFLGESRPILGFYAIFKEIPRNV